MRLTKIDKYKLIPESYTKDGIKISEESLKDRIKNNSELVDYITPQHYKDFIKLSNTRIAFTTSYQTRQGNRRPKNEYKFELRNIKSKAVKNGIITLKYEKLAFEFKNEDSYDYFIDKIMQRLKDDINIRKYLNDDEDYLREKIIKMDYKELYDFYFNEDSKEFFELLDKHEKSIVWFEEREEKYNEPNYFWHDIMEDSVRIVNPDFIPKEKNKDIFEWNEDNCGIRDWSDKTEGYI